MTAHRAHSGPEQAQKPSAPRVRLSCAMCHQRKVRCDKRIPCTNCQRLSITCVPVERARLPRGRSQKSAARSCDTAEPVHDSGNSRSRPADGTGSSSATDLPSTSVLQHDSWDGSGNGLDVQKPEEALGSSLWADLLDQTRGLPRSDNATRLGDDATYGSFLMGTLPDSLVTSLELHTNPPLEQYLCHIFLAQVDPVFKILHRHSLCAFLVDGKPYLHYDLRHCAPEALKSSIYYAAACSTSEEQWRPAFGVTRESVIARYRKETEAALLKADYINTDDLTVLQAFVLSLISTRSQDHSRRAWTMLSMALRIAQALSLHMPHPPFPLEPFEREMRRRLWHAIGMLDVQAALDRASEPMMMTSWIQSHPPSNINDDEIAFNSPDALVTESESFTDTTFTLIISKAQCVVRLLNFGDLMEPGVEHMHMRQECVVDFQKTASQLLHNCQPDTDPFHWYTRQVADCLVASMQLVALRPMKRNARFTPPHIRGDGLLKLSLEVLQKIQALHHDPRSRPWRWFEGIFVPWHALAVAIAELCVCEDPALMENCWSIVESAFARFCAKVADSQQGLLWKPIEKLMARARSRRDDFLRVPPVGSGQFPAGGSPTPESAFAGSGWQSSIPFTSMALEGSELAGQTSPLAMPSNDNLDPELNLWDVVDFNGGRDIDDTCTSWPDYKDFLDDLQNN